MRRASIRAASIVESATSGMAAQARALKLKGVDVISLSQGEPDFPTPEFICDAAKKAIDSGKYFSYPPTGGYVDLKEAIALKYKIENGVGYNPSNIVVCNGAKQALSSTILSVLDPGDEAIILGPFWVSYYAQVTLAGGKPIVINGKFENGFKPPIDQLEEAINNKTRLIIFSSPSNPTGVVYPKKDLEQIANLVLRYPDVLVISDEIYEHINYTNARVSFASLPGMFERTITINGFGKCFAMTGWRVGYLAAPEWIASEVTKMQGHLSSSNSSIAQRAALAALTGDNTSVRNMVSEYRQRRDMVHNLFGSIPGVETVLPDGAFYFFPKVSRYYGSKAAGIEIRNSDDLCTYLLKEAHVALVPGSAFGDDECVRLSYAASRQELSPALTRIQEAIHKLEMVQYA
ncbi:MAG TPA: pyridoxal phosphate-dependent aminotransferase [Cyclobacteriaceae bacterium]|nr:pyridoxal phosphate-dependent aminotransferase [Cyclobacteriaceae bacterium]